jgi:predicted alpha/beta-fold hydrolase
LQNSQLQTALGGLLIPELQLNQAEVRLVPISEDVAVLCYCHWQLPRRRSLTAVITNGADGNAHSSHVMAMANVAWHAGMNVIRIGSQRSEAGSKPAPFLADPGSHDELRTVVEFFSDQFGLDRFTLMGYSLGGNAALNVAATSSMPQLQSVAVISPVTDLDVTARVLAEPSSRRYHARALDSKKARYHELCNAYPEVFDRNLLSRVDSLEDFDECFTAPLHGYHSAAEMYEQGSSAHKLDDIAVPTLVVAGEEDMSTPLPVLEQIARAIPDAQLLTVANAAHMPTLERPDLCNPALERFLLACSRQQ